MGLATIGAIDRTNDEARDETVHLIVQPFQTDKGIIISGNCVLLWAARLSGACDFDT